MVDRRQAAHDALVERLDKVVAECLADADYEAIGRAVLAVVTSATAECERCEGRGEVTDIKNGDRMEDWLVPCSSCRGERGPLLILQALSTNGGGLTGHAPSGEVWRFPRQQEGTP